MARDTPESIEIEASSFSVWNCVITFLQIILISTMLYGAGWTHASGYNLTPFSYQNFKAVAFFFSVWALQSIAIALFLIYGVSKKSYTLCRCYLQCEAFMQIFLIVSLMYLSYRAIFTTSLVTTDGSSSPLTLTDGSKSVYKTEFSTFRPPKHFTFLAILHFVIKFFGFWIVGKYMKMLKTSGQFVDLESPEFETRTVAQSVSRHDSPSRRPRRTRQVSPPPSYAVLCKDDLPCYDEALKLCLKDSINTNNTNTSTNNSIEGLSQTNDNLNHANNDPSSLTLTQNDDGLKDQAKTPLVITE